VQEALTNVLKHAAAPTGADAYESGLVRPRDTDRT
jgi:hypothetical protein